MQQIVSITSQGQLTIPKFMLKDLGVTSRTKAMIQREGNLLIVAPRKDFWSLAGSLKSTISLSDAQLKAAREKFSKQWSSYE